MPEPQGSLVQLQSTCPECPALKEGLIQTESTIDQITPLVQRQVGSEEEEEEEEEEEKMGPAQQAPSIAMQSVEGQDEDLLFSQTIIFRKAGFTMPLATAESTPTITDRLVERQAKGEPLPAMTRQRMENAFGRDFSRVRIHRDAEAGEISRQVSALAFTHSNHIYFGKGMYDPNGYSGKRLLAHELTHVVQQGQSTPQRSCEFATPTAVRSNVPAIQRVANWAAGAVHQVNNLANVVLSGAAAGYTPPMLNGSIILSTANSRAVVARPTLTFSTVRTGGVNATVNTVPTNTGSFDETVLAPGPWTTTAPKTTIGARFPTLTQCTGKGNTTFRAIGDPTDAHMFAANRRHENHHANDHQTAFNGSFVPWDNRLTAAKNAGTTFQGKTNAGAEAALYAAMGGTPDQVADAYFNEALRLNNVYHGTAAGGPIGPPTNPRANANCATSSAKYHNPS
jgi:hypothetical protein